MNIFITCGIAEKIKDPSFARFVADSIRRHLRGDWGDVSAEDAESNDNDRNNALSAYHAPTGAKIWISQTGNIITVLFPEEY